MTAFEEMLTTRYGVEPVTVGSAEAVRGSDAVVTCTTSGDAYVCADWLKPGMVFCNVSLKDRRGTRPCGQDHRG